MVHNFHSVRIDSSFTLRSRFIMTLESVELKKSPNGIVGFI